MNTFDFITVPIIVSVVYGILTLLKKAVNDSEKVLRFIPLMAAGLGVIAFFAMPEIIHAGDTFTAILLGGALGLAATGTNQIVKQLQKFGIQIDPKTAEINKENESKEEGCGR
jgi:UDP-N-acetylmuramyl pentapeptide phosphotransferase/UDP-N-acetylglucosamine-1-phosphate transferase